MCGGRGWAWPDVIECVLRHYDPHTTVVIHGCCQGADNIADAVATRLGFSVERYPAHWRDQGRRAGFIRNGVMLREGRPDVVFAFKHRFDHTLQRGGTEHMVKIARAAGVPVAVIETENDAALVRWCLE